MGTPVNTSAVEVDVLVVGYGPVGAAIAALLGRYCVDTLVADKATDIFRAPRAIALDNEALRVLQMAGLDEQSFERIAIPGVRLRSPFLGEFGRINTCGAIDGHPKLVTFYQPDLERALRARVDSCPEVRTRLGTELLDFTQDVHGVEARLRQADGTPLVVRAKYLVAADGACSSVRRAIGQDFDGQTYPEDWLIVDARHMPRPIDHIEFICDPKRVSPHMVAPGERERWEFRLRPGEKREEMERPETIRQLLAPWGKPEEMNIERKAVYRFHARCCSAFSSGRVFLAGDAAHITPPFAGQGLVAGLRDAANLSWKLAAVTQGRAAPSILDSYDTERRPHARAMIGLAKLMGKLVAPANAFTAILVHGLVRLLRLLPPVRRFIDDLGVKPKNRFADGLFLRTPGPLVCGGQLPQGWVRDAAGRVQLSDTMMGDALALVGFGVHPAAHLGAAAGETWAAAGGKLVQVCHRGQQLHRGDGAFEDLDGTLVPGAAPCGWLAVVRPDRVVVHQGAVAQADQLVGEAVALMGLHQRPGIAAGEPGPHPGATAPEICRLHRRPAMDPHRRGTLSQGARSARHQSFNIKE